MKNHVLTNQICFDYILVSCSLAFDVFCDDDETFVTEVEHPPRLPLLISAEGSST